MRLVLLLSGATIIGATTPEPPVNDEFASIFGDLVEVANEGWAHFGEPRNNVIVPVFASPERQNDDDQDWVTVLGGKGGVFPVRPPPTKKSNPIEEDEPQLGWVLLNSDGSKTPPAFVPIGNSFFTPVSAAATAREDQIPPRKKPNLGVRISPLHSIYFRDLGEAGFHSGMPSGRRSTNTLPRKFFRNADNLRIRPASQGGLKSQSLGNFKQFQSEY